MWILNIFDEASHSRNIKFIRNSKKIKWKWATTFVKYTKKTLKLIRKLSSACEDWVVLLFFVETFHATIGLIFSTFFQQWVFWIVNLQQKFIRMLKMFIHLFDMNLIYAHWSQSTFHFLLKKNELLVKCFPTTKKFYRNLEPSFLLFPQNLSCSQRNCRILIVMNNPLMSHYVVNSCTSCRICDQTMSD